VNQIELSWLAGWLEGEGTFYYTTTKSSPTVVIQVFSIDFDVIEKAAGIMCAKIYSIKPRGNSQGGFRVHLESQPAVDLMEWILPFMGVRRTAQIKLAIESWHTRPNKPVNKLCACGCGREIFGRPRIIYARRETGACAMAAFRQRQKEIAA
jgi:hypothetical protein